MRVRFTGRALSQIRDIVDFIARDSAVNAFRVGLRIEQAAMLLVDNPQLGRKIVRSRQRRLTISKLPYLIYYRVIDGEVVILRVRHAARRRAAFHEPEAEFRV